MITGKLYNHFRKILKEGVGISLRVENCLLKATATNKQRISLSNQDPITELNSFKYNPALERRLLYKLLPKFENKKLSHWINVYYILNHPDHDAYFRCDVNKVETSNKMSIKEDLEVRKEEQFINVETSYKNVR